KQYLQARDTTDLAGNVVFSGKIALQPGIYMLIMPGLNIRFDLLIDDKQNFEISSTTENLIDKMKVKGSRCNAVFFEFQKQMAVLNPKIAELASQRDTLMKHNADSVSIQKIQKEVDILDDQAQAYWKKVANENPDLIIKPILEAMNSPKPYSGMEGTYFFENIDFSQRCIVRSPVLWEISMRVIAYNLNKQRDAREIIQQVDKLLDKAEAGDSLVFEYIYNHMLNFFNTVQRVSMNEVFVHLVETYIDKGRCRWYTADQRKQIGERSKFLRANFVGEKAVDIKLPSLAGDSINLLQLKSKFTIVYFWSTLCGHCKEAMPYMKTLTDSIPDSSKLRVFAICTDDDKKEWQKHITEDGIGKWTHVISGREQNAFREQYNVYSTPQLYMLDENFRILYRRIGPYQIEDVVKQLLSQADKFR
ncbi:MAG: hypothetical protein RIS47_1013, partial [Bacteroidota bacterium]